MKILITGGAGFIGSHVSDACISAGHEVVVVDDLSTGKRSNVNQAAAFYQVDILDPGLADVFAAERPCAVSHQAARVSVQESLRDPIGYAQVNVVGSVNVLEQCRRFGVRKIVYASTAGAGYGEPQWLPVTENHPMNALDPYGASKHHVEHYLAVYKHNFSIDYTVLRYPNVYGPRQDPHGEAGVIAIFAQQLLSGEQPTITGDGEQTRDFLHVSDVVSANLLALEASGGGTYNVGTGKGTTINEVFRGLAAETQCQMPEIHGPVRPGEVRNIYFDAGLIERELGWKPSVTLDEGLRDTVDYFRRGSGEASGGEQ